MILTARGLVFGRGSCVQGSPPGSPASSWHSVLPRPVLGLALRAVLGEPAAAGSRLVTPMVLTTWGLSFGRGSCVQGSPPASPTSSWHSVLPRPVLGLALRAVLGEPAVAYQHTVGEALDFAIGAGSGAGRA